eukprot:g17238.t1
MRQKIKTYDDRNADKPLNTWDRAQASRARQARGYIPTDRTNPAFREGRKRNQFGASTATHKQCSAMTNSSTRAGKPARCKLPAAYGGDKCHKHMSPREKAQRRDSQYRRKAGEVRQKAVLQAIRQAEIILPSDTWDQPLWQIASQSQGLLNRGNQHVYLMDAFKFGQLTMKGKAIRTHYLATLPDRSTAYRRYNAQRRWFRRNMERMVEAWFSFKNGDVTDWVALNSEASLKGWGAPLTPIISM